MRGTVGERLAGSSERHTAQLFRTTASHGVFVQEQASKVAKERKTPSYVTLLDLKRASDHVQHSCRGPASQLAWQESPATIISSSKRGLPQGAPASPTIFVAVSHHVVGSLDRGAETLDGRWTKISSSWYKNALPASKPRALWRAWTRPSDRHRAITDSIFGQQQTLDSLVRDSHTCRCAAQSLPQQRPSDEKTDYKKPQACSRNCPAHFVTQHWI